MNSIQKKISSVFFVFVFLFISILEVSAYEFPSTSFYVDLYDNALGPITLYFPSNQVEFLSLEEETQIINVSSSNITAYSPDLDYTITFQPFYYGRYRVNNSQNYQYLDIREIYTTNISFLNDENVFINQNYDSMILACSLLVVGGVILIWLKR